MTAKEVMNADVATGLNSVVETMRPHDCGFVPMVDGHGAVVGVITCSGTMGSEAEHGA